MNATLDETAARDVLLARALERHDTDEVLITAGDRRRLTEVPADRSSREPRPVQGTGGDGAAVDGLLRRARAMRELAAARYPSVARALRLAGAGGKVALATAPIAFVAGALADPLGPPKHVNLLSSVLFGLLAWNLAAYVVLLLLAVVRLGRPAAAAAGLLTGLVTSAGAWLASPDRPWIRASAGTESGALAATLRAFVADWLRVGAPLHVARARTGLHLAALAFAVGAVAGLYVRGVAMEYHAAWESTFLDADEVHAVLGAVLSPASRLTGIALPGVEELERVYRYRAGDAAASGGSARIWIHLFAVTLGLFVVVPRLALAGLSAWKARRLARALPFPLDDATLLRWSAPERGGGVRVVVLPYSTGPTSSATAEALRAMLADVLGARATVELGEPLAYGDDPPAGALTDGGLAVVVFNLAQTPEHEVHARFLEELAAQVESAGAASNGTPRVLALLDESGLRRTLGEGEAAEERLAQRRRSWDNALKDSGAAAIAVDLARPVPDAALARAREVLGA